MAARPKRFRGVLSQVLAVSCADCRMLILHLSRPVPDQTLTKGQLLRRVVFLRLFACACFTD
jgi:hypothetical protein